MTAMVLLQEYYLVTHFVYIDQLFCCCVFIYSNVHWKLVSFSHDFLYCLCLGSVYFATKMVMATAWVELLCHQSKAWQKRS